MKRMMTLFLAAVMLAGVLAGCGANADQSKYLDPVYPPHYQKAFEELMGKDLPEVAQALGYEIEDFTFEQFEGMAFIHDTPVEYLGISLYPGLMFYNFETGVQLGGLHYYTYLKEAPEEMAAKVEYMAETLQKMFGYHYNGAPYSDPSKRENAFRDLDPQELAQYYSGDEEKGVAMSWILTNDVLHIPGATEEQCMIMDFVAYYFPKEGSVRVGITCRLHAIASNLLVRTD